MGDDEANLAGGDPGAKALGRFRRDWLSIPLVRILGENLACRHAERGGAFDSERMTTSDRHMRAQQPHRPILHRSSLPARGHGDHTTGLDLAAFTVNLVLKRRAPSVSSRGTRDLVKPSPTEMEPRDSSCKFVGMTRASRRAARHWQRGSVPRW